MSEIIPQIAIILSIAGILIILGRKIPAVLDLPDEKKKKEKVFQIEEKRGKVFYFFKKIKEKIISAKPEKSTERAIVELEKILRKIRIQFLKLDQKFLVWIQKLREKSEGTFTSHNLQEKLDNLKAKKKTIRFLKKKKKREKPIIKKLDEAEKKEAELEADNSKQNENAEEEKKCIEAIAKNPKDIESYKKLGVIYLVQKNYKDAKSSFEQMLKIDPKNKKAKEELEKIEKIV